MSCNISGIVAVAQSGGTLLGQAGRRVYLRPSRTDFQFSLDGMAWQNWQGDPDLAGTYPGAISALTGGSGAWGFQVPWTDDASETRLPGGSLVPGLVWNIIDPNPTAGMLVYVGATAQAVVGAAKTIMELTTLPQPDTWAVGSVTYSAVPVGPRRIVTVPFTSAGQSASIVFPDIGSAAWKFSWGVESDDASATFYAPMVDSGSKTNTSGTIRLSDLPPVGKTVLVHVEIYV